MGTSSSPVDNSVRDLVESLQIAKIEIIQLEKTLDGFREEYEELLERHEHVLTMFYLSDPQLFEEEKDEDIPDEAFNYGLPLTKFYHLLRFYHQSKFYHLLRFYHLSKFYHLLKV